VAAGSVRRVGRAYNTISLLTDLGHGDESVGVLHAIARDLVPDVAVIDLAHDTPVGDVRTASMMLARAIGYLPEGIVVASVGVGLGEHRRHIAIQIADGAGILIGPDNGLLAPAVAMVGGADRSVVLDNDELWLPSPGAVWPVRDLLMPVAARLCEGADLGEVGSDLDPYTVQPGVVPLSRADDDGIVAEVIGVSRSGACQTNLDPDEIADWGNEMSVTVLNDDADERVAHRITNAPGAPGLPIERLGPGSIGLILDPHGLVTLVAGHRPATDELRVTTGSALRFCRLDEASAARGVTTKVQLRSPKP